MKHAILIVAHENVERLLKLSDWFDADFDIYIHIDKKSRLTGEEREKLAKHPRIKLVCQKYRVYWGGINFLKCILWLSEKACLDAEADYIHVISGVDFPVKNILNFKAFFEEKQGHEFLDYFSLPTKRWKGGGLNRLEYYALNDIMDVRTALGGRRAKRFAEWQERWHIRRKVPDDYPRFYGGSNWWSLSRECVLYVVRHTRQKRRFFRRLYFTFAADELYFQTVLLNSPYADKMVNNNLRYIVWKRRNGGLPANLDLADLKPIVLSDCFFARKIDLRYSGELIAQLDTLNRNTLYFPPSVVKDKRMLLDEIAMYLFEQGEKWIFNGLLHGKLGMAIFLFHYAKHTNCSCYSEKAYEWLGQIIESIGTTCPLDYADGIIGIGVGIEYLHIHGMIEDDTNEILEEIDRLALNLAEKRSEYPDTWSRLGLDKYVALRSKNRFEMPYQQRQVFERLAGEPLRKEEANAEEFPMSLEDYAGKVNRTNRLGIVEGYAGIGMHLLFEISDKTAFGQESFVIFRSG